MITTRFSRLIEPRQVLLVLLFWISRIVRGNPESRSRFVKVLNARLGRFTPWQIIISTLTTIYAIKNSDKILGLQAPEPLARLYARDYYRASVISFDAYGGAGEKLGRGGSKISR